ncbi:hypothetical protein AGDE_00701 [Angomonas deanei]|uniref:Roadblock/LC7 domain containing protein, putative n=1 Tax=Angomonas deanei TaxID=59799 RepID=S9VP21_9TRYP|nr:hypothetical protein AGDE_01310 [Angomonas deanei]EPY43221.1 hypothetical protein AGDE_00701 [Angomonas deanei]CAD2215981.1 Roadblock/LC7 domain containing protein, putative [Angomonas deanei]|eukprot:EPY42613.1 hypothetical protein AGDE_01310 [Angomonas deanei]
MADERIESVMEHITYTKGVVGVVVCDREGNPIRDSFQSLDRGRATTLASLAADLVLLAAPLASLEIEKEKEKSKKEEKKSKEAGPSTIEVMRVQSLSYEIIIKCNEDFLLVVVQEPVG